VTALNAATAVYPAASPARSTPRRPMAAVAAIAAGAALALTGCSAGQITQTSAQVAAVNGNNADVGSIALRNVHIVYPTETHTNVAGGDAVLALSLVNNDEITSDQLTNIDTDLGSVRITGPRAATSNGSTIELAPQETVVAAGSRASNSNAANQAGQNTNPATDDPEADPALIEITGLTKDITPGLTYAVTFDFKDSGTVEMEVPVDAGLHTDRHEGELSGSTEGSSHGGGH